jgi:hypothetical protein
VNTEAVTSTAGTADGPTGGRVSRAWEAVEEFLVYAGDRLNPILVKETRQALKSFQFTATFVLVLICCWVVTIGVAAAIGPSIFYAAAGGTFLLWYYAILAFPLTVVVPLAAFRSLMAEREDNTFELLSITTLKSRQIISGKLGSAVAQMGVYFSAITPCLAFTYLLRGVDLPTIAFLVGYTFLWSLGLSMIGILLATLSSKRYVHVFILVGFVGSLLWMFYIAMVAAYYLVTDSYSFIGDSGFWIGVAVAGTLYVTFFALAFFAAAGMITFASENRSTPLRICMLVQAAAIVGWMVYGWIKSDYELFAVLWLAGIAGIYWYAMGTMLTAERPGMSQRVKRRLPHSALGRMFFSWLNPGPASGYMFVVANATALALLCFLGAIVSTTIGRNLLKSPDTEELLYLLVIGWAYLVAYLGTGLLVIGVLRRFAVVTMLASVLIHFLLLLGGFGIPYAIKSMSMVLRDADYTFLQIADPFFSLYHVAEGGVIADTRKLFVIIPSVSLCVLLANLPGVIRELRVVREAAPKRVLEDEAELHPPPEALPSNPWDEKVEG